MAFTTLTSCTKTWTLFEDKPLIEELPLSFEVMRTYVGKNEADLDALLIRLGCTREDEPIYFSNGWNLIYVIHQDMAHMTYYTYVDGDDSYIFVLNSTNKSGKTFQVCWEKDYDSQIEQGLGVLDKEIQYTEGKKPRAFDAKYITVGGELHSSFDSKDDFISEVKEYAESIPLWGISCNYTLYEGTLVFYSQVNYGAGYINTRCLGNNDVDVDLNSITNHLNSMATVHAESEGADVEIMLDVDAFEEHSNNLK